jgi:hypothetical protein
MPRIGTSGISDQPRSPTGDDRDDARTRAAHHEAGVCVQIEDHAFVVGKGEQEVRPGNLRGQGLEFGLRQPAHESSTLTALRQVAGQHHRNLHRCIGVQAAAHAAHPAVQDLSRRQAFGRQCVAARPHGIGAGHRQRVSPQHGVSSRRSASAVGRHMQHRYSR